MEKTFRFEGIPRREHQTICTELRKFANVSVTIMRLAPNRGSLRISAIFPEEFEKARAWVFEKYGEKVQAS